MVKNGIGMMLRSPTMLEVGTEAPEFTAKAHDGSTVRLSDFRGKKVLLWFYPKADTPGCTAEGCSLRDRFAEFDPDKIQVLGVSFDTVDDNRKFAEKFGFPYLLLCDPEAKIGAAYGAGDSGFASRISYIIDEQGRIAHALPNVNPKTHTDEVLARIQ